MSRPSITRLPVAVAVGFALCVTPSRAEAVPTQIAVFINSIQKIHCGWPDLSLFAFDYSRADLNVLGVYAGPRWTVGNLGVELKTGAYGGGTQPTKAIANVQVDYSTQWFSLTSFTDYYPVNEVYSYASAFAILGPVYVGALGDLTHDWGPDTGTVLSGGPSLGAGTKKLYLATTWLFRSDRSQAVRLTVGMTF